MSAIGGNSAGPALHHQLGDTDEPNDGNASVKKRTNVLLLSDHLGDLGMSDGLNYENQIIVGFLRCQEQPPSDFSIAQFRFLERLLVVHGH
ncbi:probable phospholipid-transporting ATPase 4 [Magnolia sinica]|uniref:probable phospholipid-transporting ATPase 4 n=1 Tax=Magnolia sinica TaxID=86752 RepID=UPI00265A12E2|nr:probable phospholipid-transporting ATPase 4 [Magnolia sinica]XP_058083935.1 probable phospholipid-transporting ATPase 4 [Magnolia sinica]XP_058083936.1 probable phospholipid-transporting ATPase 4 [Magnolia sinica]